MQENSESEKPEDSQIPENQEEVPDEEINSESSESTESDTSFEEKEGEVLPPEKKKGSGCGLFLFILLLLTGGSGYLYYTDQIPPQISKQIEPVLEQIEPLLKPLKQQLARINPESTSQKIQKPEVEQKTPTPTVPKEIPIVEEKPEIAPSPLSEEHISGSPAEPIPEVDEADSNYPAEVSGNTTISEREPEIFAEEPETAPKEHSKLNQTEETIVPPVETPSPVITAPAQPAPIVEPPSTEESQLKEEPTPQEETARSEAVQAYLDFVEATLAKIGELIKTGFNKGKDLIKKSLG